MKKREGRYGEFYGCTQFRSGCRGIRKVIEVETYGQGVVYDEQAMKKAFEIKDAEETKDTCNILKKRIEEQNKPQTIDIPTDDSDVKLIETKEYPYLDFKFPTFNPVQSRIFQYYDKDINLITAASTSAGKTTVAEMLMADSIHKGKKTVFLSPLKAVSQEKYDDWTDESHGWSKLNVSIVTGDYQLTEVRVKELNAANVIIMTSEMLDSRTRRIYTEKNDWLLNVGTIVVDESHLLNMPGGRGDRLESAIMRFTKQNSNCRVVFLSATMPNVSELALWLTSLNGKKTELINSSFRPCKLDINFPTYFNRGSYAQKENNKIRETINITQQYPNDKFIIFVHSKATGRRIKAHLDDLNENAELHNAELTKEQRIKVVEEFKSRDKKSLRIIVATSGLAWGINIPARRCIIVGWHRGLTEVHPYDIKQMVGRAGRVGFDPKGDAYILTPDNKTLHYKNIFANMPPITSTMNDSDTLAFHIVSEISDSDVDNIISLMDWYNRSLAAFQNDYLERADAENLLEKLKKAYILEEENGKYKVTKLGQIASYLYYSPYSISGWYLNFSRIFNEESCDDYTISWAIANINENMDNFIQKAYIDAVKDYKMQLTIRGISVPDGIAWIGFVYHQCITNGDLDDSYKRIIQYDAERIITAIEMIDNNYSHWNKGNWWNKLQSRIQYGVTWKQAELCSLKGIGGVYVRKLFDEGIKSIDDFVNNSKTSIVVLGKKTYNKILKDNNL